MSSRFKPKFITFDAYGTLVDFQMSSVTRNLLSDQVGEEEMGEFLDDFEAYRMDEVLGAYKPYPQVIKDALRRACQRRRVDYRESDGEEIVAAIPTWGPHAEVPDALNALAEHYRLVILSNAKDDQIKLNVEKLGAPFHAVCTAEQARGYKPQFRPFEYMLEVLDCDPSEILHVSASLWYDLIPAHHLRITEKVYINRGYEPSTPFYGYTELADLSELPGLLLD